MGLYNYTVSFRCKLSHTGAIKIYMTLENLIWGLWDQEPEFYFASNKDLLKREEPVLSM